MGRPTVAGKKKSEKLENGDAPSDNKAALFGSLINDLTKKHGDGSVYYKNNLPQVPRFPMTVIGLALISSGGIPRGRIMEFYGNSSSGKTTIALTCAADVLRNGGSVMYIDMEHALDPDWTRIIGVDLDSDKFAISQPESAEQALDMIRTCVQSGACDLVVLDSVPALTSVKEISGEIGEGALALKARLLSSTLPQLVAPANKNGCSVIFINQVREKPGISFGDPTYRPGGKALNFYSSIVLEVRRKQKITIGANIAGFQTGVKATKSKIGKPFRACDFDIMFNEGISVIGEIVDMGVDAGLINKAGAYFKYNDITIGQGRENAKKYLQENTDVAFEIHQDILKSLELPPLESKPSYHAVPLELVTTVGSSDSSDEEEFNDVQIEESQFTYEE
jgi:recombination protein RecA